MSAPITTAAPVQTTSVVRRPIQWKLPIAYGVLSLVAVALYAVAAPAGEHSTFQLARGQAWITIPNFALPSKATGVGISLVLVALAVYSAWNASRRVKTGRWLPATFGVLFVFGFLVYAGASTSGVIPLTALLAGGLALSVPLIFGAMCGLVGERSGIVNIAIEGQLLLGAFFAAVAASLSGNAYVGLLAAPIAGALVGALLVWFAVSYWVDQIIVGVVLNVLVVGLTNFLFSTVLTQNSETWNARQRLPSLPIPVLSEIPVLGPVLFNQTILVYLMYAVVILLNIFVFRSRWGLRMRAVGEHPKAADTVGIKVNRTRGSTPSSRAPSRASAGRSSRWVRGWPSARRCPPGRASSPWPP